MVWIFKSVYTSFQRKKGLRSLRSLWPSIKFSMQKILVMVYLGRNESYWLWKCRNWITTASVLQKLKKSLSLHEYVLNNWKWSAWFSIYLAFLGRIGFNLSPYYGVQTLVFETRWLTLWIWILSPNTLGPQTLITRNSKTTHTQSCNSGIY